MPALEAAFYGLVPILSRESALSEAVNGVAMEVDPLSVPDIGQAMEAALALNEEKRKEWKNALIAHAQSATRERFLGEWEELITSELR
jgi:trehalose-6-phosphate synthase